MTKEGLAKVVQTFMEIQEKSSATSMSAKQIFLLINELDQRFRGNPYYDFAVDGLICNLGMEHQHVSVLNLAVSRLTDKLATNPKNKHRYDLGNAILTIAELENPYPRPVKNLLKVTKYNLARKHFALVQPDDNTSFERAITNSANILEKYGRNFEAIHLYDAVLNHNPGFGMALANKARAINYYIRLSPVRSYRLMRTELGLLRDALATDSIDEVGGPLARASFEQQLDDLTKFLKRHKQLDRSDLGQPPDSISDYQRYCMERNLYLNFDFGYYYDQSSLQDSFFPNFVDSLVEKQSERNGVMSERVYFSFQVFNQILETYTATRFQYFQATANDYASQDSQVGFTYTYDYTRHGHKYGLMKSSFCELYNCLDKVGHPLHYYFTEHIPNPKKLIAFSWLLSEEFAEIVSSNGNFQLLALRNLALDFEEGYQYYGLGRIRNRLTHAFLNVNNGIAYDERFSEYETTEELLGTAIGQLFIIVKSAVMYAVIAVTEIRPDEPIPSMVATQEKEVSSD